MASLDPHITAAIALWPAPAQSHLNAIRRVFTTVADDLEGCQLTESLKWGQPTWRPLKGATSLRLGWSAKAPETLDIFVDCKTDLLERMQDAFPKAFLYTAPRVMHQSLDDPLPEDALTHLARIGFAYTRQRPRS